MAYSNEGWLNFPAFIADRIAGKTQSDNPAVQAMHEIFDSEYAQTRIQGGRNQVQRDMLGKLEGTGAKYWEAYARKSMIFTKIGDIIPTLIFGQGFVRAKLEEAAGMGMMAEEGRQWAMDKLWMLVEATQTSASITNWAAWQRTGGSYGKLAGQFTGPKVGFWAKQVHDVRMLRFAKEGEDKARIKEAWKQAAKTSTINFAVLSTLYTAVGILWNWMLGREPDERDAEKMLVSLLTGPFGGMFITGQFVEAAAEGLVSGSGGFGSDLTPASGMINVGRNSTAALNQFLSGDLDGALKLVDNIMKQLNAPYRDASKAVKNLSK